MVRRAHHERGGLPVQGGRTQRTSSQGAPKGSSQGAPKGSSQGAPQGSSQGAPKGGSQGAPKGGSHGEPVEPRALIVFLGPSLGLRHAREIVKADYRPPARQGDVFRALADRPRAIALIDGVFEGAPSVWHHELRAALAAGVTVFGASSMGALRAVELHSEGMIGIGAIYERYARGESEDDGDVAVLHADASRGSQALTVPLVNVIATLDAAKRSKVLTLKQAASVLAIASGLFFQDRRWPTVLAKCPPAIRATLSAWLDAGHEVDQKALDARTCLATAKTFIDSAAHGPASRPFAASSFVRRRRLTDVHRAPLERLSRRSDARTLEADGTRRLLLAAFAKAGGLEVTAAERAEARRALAPAEGLAADELEFIAEIVALEAKVLAHPERFVADGPSRLEGLALEAVLRGLWR